ncbi:MAG: CRISPR-associated endonuclease Cas1 [Planctomycetales bacterium]|nr:CRISPR-associated endonuclease Cas1 [Planctomycetales bacterium]MCA9197164.1 CRISPR-associated endonuclease Cas1 [Planctomycetales bacterium]
MQLVINTHGTSLRRRGERLVISHRNLPKPVELAASKIQSIVVASGIQITSGVIELAAQHDIDICFLAKDGHPISRIWQSRIGSTVAIRRAQLAASDNPTGTDVVRSWIAKKLENQHRFLTQLQSKRPDRMTVFDTALRLLPETIEKLRRLTGKVDDQRSTIMGLEGVAGRVYFECLAKLMPSEYQFSGRSRRPATDPFNAMLNYAYGVLYSQVERAQILAGLDPHIGFLHTDNYNKPSLVFDMIEPFRIIAEKATVLFFTGRRVKREFFREVPGGIELAPEGRAALITNLNERLDKSVKYPIQQPKRPGGKKTRRIKLRVTIQYEAHALANQLLGRNDLPRIVESDALFENEDP